MKVMVYQVFGNQSEQQAHSEFIRLTSNWNTITAVILIVLFWLYQKFIGANISNVAH